MLLLYFGKKKRNINFLLPVYNVIKLLAKFSCRFSLLKNYEDIINENHQQYFIGLSPASLNFTGCLVLFSNNALQLIQSLIILMGILNRQKFLFARLADLQMQLGQHISWKLHNKVKKIFLNRWSFHNLMSDGDLYLTASTTVYFLILNPLLHFI